MKITGIEFPEPLCTALRDGKLVVFAGAGVSKGEPANLPIFKNLADAIALGTGLVLEDHEPVDRFLGRLQHQKVDVHARAAKELSKDDPHPTELHRDLLRLCSGGGQVRIVTTNFDLLFEQAAKDVFNFRPEVFRAPALPLGRSFNGIVHVHGAVSHSDGMVLTDQDFGRAYLTEGWARRFLVALFRQSTVLFVGYGHNDTVMNYLARALPESEADKRFALTGESSQDLQHWRALGIAPIVYAQASEHDHSRLNDGVHRLAEVFGRRVLDWQREINELAEKKPPPLDGEEADLISEAFKDEAKTRFFTAAASSPEWIDWLDKRGHLDALFGSSAFSQRDRMLALWLAERFAYQHADDLFLLITRHNTYLHQGFWLELGRKIGQKIELDKQDPLDEKDLSRWVALLLATAPVNADDFVWSSIGERCAKKGLVGSLLQVFEAMTGSRPVLKTAIAWSDDGQDDQGSSVEVALPLVGDRYGLERLWEIIQKKVVPTSHWAQVAEPLLGIVVRRLEKRYLTRRSWQQAEREWDPESFHRSAIEPHEQNGRRRSDDVLIDVARDCLEWLAANQADTVTCLCDQLVGLEAPLLRRLAVHTLSARTEMTADQKIGWLLKHIDLHDSPARHEIFQAVKLAYPEAGPERRAALIEAVLAYHWPDEKALDKEQRTAYSHLDWLHWLSSSDPDCQLAREALNDIQSKHPDYQPEEHPDFRYWFANSGWVGPQSPWSVEELLAKPASEWLPELLSFQTTEFLGPDRVGLVRAIHEAGKQNFDWGIALADALAGAETWDVDLWSGLMGAWSELELDENSYRRVLKHLDRVELYPKHARTIAAALNALVKNQGTLYALKLLPQANKIAKPLWAHLDRDEVYEESDDWLHMAINDAAGVLAEFWLGSLAIWSRHQKPLPKALSDEYSMALSCIVQDGTLAGRLGRSFFAGRFAFLLEVDEAWTKENLLPFFYAENSNIADFQATWDGFLPWGRLNPAVAEHLSDAFLKAVQRIDGDLASRRDQFVSRYTTMLGYFAADPLVDWVPELFRHGGEEVRRRFAFEVRRQLSDMDEARQREWWCRWLKRYWENRLQGVPAPLESDEVERMLSWLPKLTAVFSEAVALAIRMLKEVPTAQLERGYGVIYGLSKNGSLVQNHPEEIAQLLICLGKFDSFLFWHEGRELIDRLLQSDLSPELKQELKELKAKRDL